MLLYGEQGFGDVIQFSRFVPQEIDSGGQILLGVRPELVTLFIDQFSDLAGVVSRDGYLPNHDLILPILSLPRVFGLELSGIQNKPYLQAKSQAGTVPLRPSDTITLPLPGLLV